MHSLTPAECVEKCAPQQSLWGVYMHWSSGKAREEQFAPACLLLRTIAASVHVLSPSVLLYVYECRSTLLAALGVGSSSWYSTGTRNGPSFKYRSAQHLHAATLETMPLFDSIESDVTAFLVSQGSVFDTLVKSFMDRVARVEARVETLAVDTNESLQSVSQQMQMLSAAADAHAATTLAQLEQVSQTAAAMAAMAAAATASAATDHHSSDTSDTTSAADTLSTRDPLVYSHEVEYYIMTLARQLHVVLELFFQPHAPDNVEDVQSTQARFESISDVLTLNEAILMQLSAANAPEPSAAAVGRVPIEPILEDSDEDAKSDVASEENDEGPDNDESDMKDDDALHHHEGAADDDLSESTMGRPDTQLPSDSSLSSAIVPGSSTEPARPPRSRKKSLYDSFRDFHELQLSEAERKRLREAEWLHKVQQMLATAKKHWRDEVAAAVTLAWQEKIRELESHQMKLQSEWKYLQEQQRPHDLLLQQQQHQQEELDRQVAVLSDSLLAAQQVQKKQLAEILESLRAFQDQYASKAEFNSMASAWLQAARDECVFGVNADALVALKHEMEAFHAHLVTTLASETSPLLEQLLGEVNRVMELLTQLLELLSSDGAGWHGAKGFETMQTLRTFLTGLDNLTQSLESDRGESARSAAFVSETLRQMELGAANLLEAFETQQDRYQHAFEQQQRAITQLQFDLRDQRDADEELKRQLAGCPSQEDTLRVIQDLRSQVRQCRA